MAIESAPPKGADLFAKGAPPNSLYPTAGFGLTLDHNGRVPSAQVLAPDPTALKYLKTDASGALSWARPATTDLSDNTAWTTYDLAWTSTGTQPAIGDGSLEGLYTKIGKTVFVVATMVAGSTTTFGTGGWRFSLPSTANRLYVTGAGDVTNSGVGTYLVTAETISTTTMRALNIVSPVTELADGAPFAFGNGDYCRLTLWYQEA